MNLLDFMDMIDFGVSTDFDDMEFSEIEFDFFFKMNRLKKLAMNQYTRLWREASDLTNIEKNAGKNVSHKCFRGYHLGCGGKVGISRKENCECYCHKKISGGKWAVIFLQVEREKRGNQCQYYDNRGRCKEKTDLEFAHLKPTNLKGRSRGSFNRLHDIRANPDSYVLYCSYHHEQFDRGKES